MRYTEEKDTKNIFRSQAVTVSNRWDKSAYSSFFAIIKTASFSSGKKPMDWLPWTGLEILKTLAVFSFRPPSDNTATVNSPENTGSSYSKALFFGLLNHQEDL